RRVRLTSSRSSGSVRLSLSNTRVTSARLRAGRVAVPAKTTSSIFGVRRLLVDWVPITQETASTRFDLPDPLGPTITVTPGRSSSRVRSANDLNPTSLRDFRYMNYTRVSRAPKVSSADARIRVDSRTGLAWSSAGVGVDEEVAQGGVGGDGIGLDPRDRRRRRTRPQPVDQAVAGVGVALGPHLHPAVGEVAHPAVQAQRSGGLAATLPIGHILDPAGDVGVNGLHNVSVSRLATGTEVAGALGDDDPLDRRTAGGTRFALASVDSETVQILPCPAV